MRPTEFLYFDTLQTWAGHGPPPRRGAIARPGPAYLHRPGRDGHRYLRPSPSRGMLGIVCLLGLCMVVACGNARPVPASPVPPPGIDLRAQAPSPKVKTTSAELPPVPPPAPAQQPEPEKSTVDPLPLPLAPPAPAVRPKEEAPPKLVEPLPPPVEPPPPGVAEVKPPVVNVPRPPPEPRPAPVVEVSQRPAPVGDSGPASLTDSCFKDLHRGETPMMRNWTVLRLSSVMAVALAAASPAVAGPTEFGQDKKLADIEAKLDNLIDNVTKMYNGNTAEMRGLRDSVDKLRAALEDTAFRLNLTAGKLKALEDRVEALEKALSKSTTSFYPKPTSVGRIQLANMYPEEMLFMINGKPYRVAPFTTMMLENQPPGSFGYEVISGKYGVVRGLTTPTLLPGETYTITVR
jgi:hypothetical protein